MGPQLRPLKPYAPPKPSENSPSLQFQSPKAKMGGFRKSGTLFGGSFERILLYLGVKTCPIFIGNPQMVCETADGLRSQDLACVPEPYKQSPQSESELNRVLGA